jgi:hypothetical protein
MRDLQEYLKIAKESDIDMARQTFSALSRDLDDKEMGLMMIDQGLTNYQAAKEQFSSGRTERSLYALQYRARNLEMGILKYLGFSLENAVEKLVEGDWVVLPESMRIGLKKRAKDNDWGEIEERHQFRIKPKEEL